MESLWSTLPAYREAFFRLFFPCVCIDCGQLLELEEKGLCRPCGNELQKFRFLPSEERIRLPLPNVEEGWALFRYDGLVKDLIHKIKFERRRDLIHLFDQDMVQFLERRSRLSSYDALLPIPLDPHRRLEREFNQSALLALKIQKILGIPVESNGLKKMRSSPAQSLLGREARRLNLERAFHVPNGRRVKNRSFLLVDDIFTTGATIEEAVKTLKAAGAARIGYLALARAVGS